MKITPEIEANRAKWLAALRRPGSGKRVGCLEDVEAPHKRCCLGHACAALAPGLRFVDTLAGARVRYRGHDKTLPAEVSRMLGIDREGTFRATVDAGGRSNVGLMELNDATNLTSAEIADVIEAQFRLDNFESPDDEL